MTPGGMFARSTPRKTAPACGAVTRSGKPCTSRILLKGGRCRFHSGKPIQQRKEETHGRIT